MSLLIIRANIYFKVSIIDIRCRLTIMSISNGYRKPIYIYQKIFPGWRGIAHSRRISIRPVHTGARDYRRSTGGTDDGRAQGRVSFQWTRVRHPGGERGQSRHPPGCSGRQKSRPGGCRGDRAHVPPVKTTCLRTAIGNLSSVRIPAEKSGSGRPEEVRSRNRCVMRPATGYPV